MKIAEQNGTWNFSNAHGHKLKKNRVFVSSYITVHPLMVSQNLINIQYNIYRNKPGITLLLIGNIHSSHKICK